MGRPSSVKLFSFGPLQTVGPFIRDRDLTLKTVFLLALATGKRRGKLHALAKDVRWLSGAVRAVEILPVPEFLSKIWRQTAGSIETANN